MCLHVMAMKRLRLFKILFYPTIAITLIAIYLSFQALTSQSMEFAKVLIDRDFKTVVHAAASIQPSVKADNFEPPTIPSFPISKGRKDDCVILCQGLLKDSKSSLPVRQGFIEECNKVVCSAQPNSSFRQVVLKIYDYIQWVKDIDKRIKDGDTEIFNSDIKWMHIQRGKASIGIGGMVANTRIAFLLSILSRRFFLADFVPQCNETILLWKPNVIPWRVTDELDRRLHIRKGPHQKLDCEAVFSKTKVLLADVHIKIRFNERCGANEMFLFRKHPGQDDRILVFLSALLTHLLLDFGQPDALYKQIEAFKIESGLPSKYVSLHVRTGLFSNGRMEDRLKYKLIKVKQDNGTWVTRNPTRYVPDEVAWASKIRCALRFIQDHDIDFPLLLITDSTELKKYARINFGSSKIVSTDIEAIHTQLDVALAKNISIAKCQKSFFNALVDVWLLASSEYFILAISTFSTLSSNLGLIPYRKQICCDHCPSYRYPIIRF